MRHVSLSWLHVCHIAAGLPCSNHPLGILVPQRALIQQRNMARQILVLSHAITCGYCTFRFSAKLWTVAVAAGPRRTQRARTLSFQSPSTLFIAIPLFPLMSAMRSHTLRSLLPFLQTHWHGMPKGCHPYLRQEHPWKLSCGVKIHVRRLG